MLNWSGELFTFRQNLVESLFAPERASSWKVPLYQLASQILPGIFVNTSWISSLNKLASFRRNYLFFAKCESVQAREHEANKVTSNVAYLDCSMLCMYVCISSFSSKGLLYDSTLMSVVILFRCVHVMCTSLNTVLHFYATPQ